MSRERCHRDGARKPLRLTVKVVPRASTTEIVGWLPGDVLKVRVQAAPTDGRANDAVTTLLATLLALPRDRVQIVAGRGSTRKLIAIDGAERADLEAALAKL